MTRSEAYIALNMIDTLGPVRVRNLAEALGSPEAILEADEQQLQKTEGIGPEVARKIVEQRGSVSPAEEMEKASRIGARIVAFVDPEYPEPLKSIYDPPLALYVKGTLEKRDRHAVAMVGTRHATHYGLSVSDRLSYQLAKVGFTVVSGLARGIDTAAHRGAIKGGGRTLAVIGSALDRLYPPENEDLAAEIAEHGALISEYTMGRQADRTTFPYRNRVVSGLSMGIVVVEAGAKSGAIITAEQAAEQGKTVFGVPGRIDMPGSKGVHALIKTGARLVDDVEDILQEFQFLIPDDKGRADRALPRRPEVPLNESEQLVVRALWGGPLDVDALARAAALKSAEISSLLLGLEMKKVVRILPGRMVDLREELRES
jgi:DNA processing protein